jgi:hypothetical protein
MSDIFKNQAVDDSLIAAFKSLKEQATPNIRPEKISEQYTKYFSTVEPRPNLQHSYFERFSLVDPNIRVILTSTTKTVP